MLSFSAGVLVGLFVVPFLLMIYALLETWFHTPDAGEADQL